MNWKEFTTTYKIFCVLISIALTWYWSCKYSKDEDTSLVSYTLYTQSKTIDEYPVLSFCFINPFLKERLKEYGIFDETKYLEFLEGNHFLPSFTKIPYENISYN